jgi:hypothetical protein
MTTIVSRQACIFRHAATRRIHSLGVFLITWVISTDAISFSFRSSPLCLIWQGALFFSFRVRVRDCVYGWEVLRLRVERCKRVLDDSPVCLLCILFEGIDYQERRGREKGKGVVERRCS